MIFFGGLTYARCVQKCGLELHRSTGKHFPSNEPKSLINNNRKIENRWAHLKNIKSTAPKDTHPVIFFFLEFDLCAGRPETRLELRRSTGKHSPKRSTALDRNKKKKMRRGGQLLRRRLRQTRPPTTGSAQKQRLGLYRSTGKHPPTALTVNLER